MLNRADLLAALRPKFKDMEVEGIGAVRIAQIGVKSRTDLFEIIRKNLADIAAYDADQKLPEGEREGLEPVVRLDQALLTIASCIVDENGDRMFSYDDLPFLEKLSFEQIAKLWEAVSGFQKEPTAVEIEDQKKSSARTRKSASPSA